MSDYLNLCSAQFKFCSDFDQWPTVIIHSGPCCPLLCLHVSLLAKVQCMWVHNLDIIYIVEPDRYIHTHCLPPTWMPYLGLNYWTRQEISVSKELPIYVCTHYL